ncbi:hypothetical protein OUZ56_017658 [Daphnia magna]|uniref:Uncharacterized protein n=1 Tax=Daphnia magna TaxID=35525 RepID=A0ABR0ATV0_9CRUS|nr:hypothetical protein OUZ56_017658 [Daphnia magna]
MIGCPHKEERKNADQEFFQIQMHLPYKMHARHQHLPSEKAKTNIDTKLKYNQKWNAYNIKCVLLYSAQRSEIYRYDE